MSEEKKSDLLVVSNHPPDGWSEKQREGWDTVDYIPFPNVPPTFSFQDVTEMCPPILEEIAEWINSHEGGKISIQGESTLVSIVMHEVDLYHGWVYVFPTTERVAEEKDGKKTSTFKFVRWR